MRELAREEKKKCMKNHNNRRKIDPHRPTLTRAGSALQYKNARKIPEAYDRDTEKCPRM